MARIEYIDRPVINTYTPMDALSDFVSSGINAYFEGKEEEDNALKAALPTMIAQGYARPTKGSGDFSYGGLEWEYTQPAPDAREQLEVAKLRQETGQAPDWSSATMLAAYTQAQKQLADDPNAKAQLDRMAKQRAKQNGTDPNYEYDILTRQATESLAGSIGGFINAPFMQQQAQTQQPSFTDSAAYPQQQAVQGMQNQVQQVQALSALTGGGGGAGGIFPTSSGLNLPTSQTLQTGGLDYDALDQRIQSGF